MEWVFKCISASLPHPSVEGLAYPLPFPLPAVSVGLLLVLLMQARAYVSLGVFSGRLFHEVLLSRDVTQALAQA